MKNQLSRLLLLIPALACTVLFHAPVIAQSLQVERLAAHINGIAFRGNELWQVYTSTLVKRNLITGDVEATFEAPDSTDGFQDIAIDVKGDIWLPLGKDGIARFDGSGHWEIWNNQNVPTFPSQMSFFNVVVEASTGRVWAYGRTENQYLYFTYDGNAWAEDVALRNFYWSRFINGPQGQFVLSANDTLLIRQNNNWTAIPEPGEYKYTPFGKTTFDAQGQLWLTGKSHLYRYKNLSTLPDTMTILSSAIEDMVFDDTGTLYLATKNQGLGIWNGDSLTFMPSLAGNSKKTHVWEIQKDPLGRLWLIQDLQNQLFYFALALTLWDNGAPQKNFYYGIPQAGKMSPDRAGNMWFGGYEPLLVRKNASDGSLDYFEMFDVPQFFSYYTRMKPGLGKEMWLKTTYNKLIFFNGNTWSPFTIPNPTDDITGFCTDSKGRFYIGDSYTIKFRDPGTSTWTDIDLSVLDGWQARIRELTLDNADNLWFSSTRGLGSVSNGSREMYALPESNADISDVQTGPAGMVYVVTNTEDFGGTAHLFRFNSLIKEWNDIAWPDPSMPEWILRAPYTFRWHVDLQGRIWITVNTYYDGSDWRYWYWENDVWTEIYGLPADGIDDITCDSKGTVYLGNHKILAQFKSETVGGLQHDKTQQPSLWVFPNPASNHFWVKAPAENGLLDLYDAQGNWLKTLQIQSTSVPIPVDAGDLPEGLYLLRFTGKDQTSTAGKVVLKRI